MKFTSRRLFNFSFILATIFTCVNFSLYQARQVSTYKNLLEVSEKRNELNSDQLNELFLTQFKSLENNDVVLAKNQGVLEGLLKTINPTQDEMTSSYGSIWHDGYEQGLEQNKWVATESYTEGYHLGIDHALRDIGSDHPAFRYTSENGDEDKVDIETTKGLVKAKSINRSSEEEFELQIKKYIEEQFQDVEKTLGDEN